MDWEKSSESLLRDLGALAQVGSVPTYELIHQKHNLEVMLQCCCAEESTYWSQPKGSRICAAPFFFERAAILLGKQKAYAEQIQICDRWESIVADFQGQPMVQAGKVALTHLGPSAASISTRRLKALEKLQKG